MKRTLLFYSILLCFSHCYSQKDSLIIKKLELDSLVKTKYTYYPINKIKNYDLSGLYDYPDVFINEEGLYQYENSGLVTANMMIYIEDIFNNDDSCTSELDYSFGYLKGDIVKGEKEGKWEKKISYKKKKGEKRKGYILVKESHYKNGLLDGKYQVFDKEGNVLYPNMLSSNDSSKKVIDYSIFKEGTGNYYDYYYETGVLKKEGYYLHGKKHNTWFYYNEEGKVTHAEHYIKGVLINDY